MPRLLPEQLAGATPNVPAAPRQGGGQIVGQGQAELARAIGQAANLTARIAEEGERARARRILSESTEAMQELQFELESDPDFETHEQRFQERSKELRDGALEQIRIPGIRDDAAIVFDQTRLRFEMSVRENVRERISDQGRADLTRDLKSRSSLAARADDEESRAAEIALADLSIESALSSGFIDAEIAEKLKEDLRQEVAGAWVEEGRVIDPEGTISALERGAGPAEFLSEGDRAKAIAALQAEMRSRQSEQRAMIRFLQEQRDRALEEAKVQKFNEGLDLLDRGELTPLWLSENGLILEEKRDSLRRIMNEGRPDADEAYVEELRTMSQEDPGQFAKIVIDPVRAGNRLGLLRSLQQKVRDQGQLDSQTLSLLQRVRSTSEVLGLTQEQFLEFDERVNDEIEEFVRRNNGRRPDRKQQQAIIDGLTLEVRGTVGRFDLFGVLENLGRIGGEGEELAGIAGPLVEPLIDFLEDSGSSVTEETIQELDSAIRSDLRRAGLDPTPQNIVELLRRKRETGI